MGKKRKTFNKSDWLQYEYDFFNLCKERNWLVEPDEDDCPILRPASARKRGLYNVCPWGPGVVALVVLGTNGKTKLAMQKKFQKANIDFTVHVEGEFDIIMLFDVERLPRAVKTLNLRKKKQHTGNTESLERAHEGLRKYWAERKKSAE